MTRGLGELLASLRDAAELTQEELARKSGVSVRSISDLERDKVAKPRRRTVELLAAALDLDPAQTKTLIAARGTALDPATDAKPAVPLNLPRDPVVPRQLPAAIRHFIGRQDELDVLVDACGQVAVMRHTVTVAAIEGMPGVGKTSLAVQAAHQLAGKFADGQLFIDLHGYTQGHKPRAPEDALDWLLRALGIATQQIPLDLDGRAALYRQRLAETQTLIVLDNAVSEEQVRPLLPGSAGCLVLVTSRRYLRGLDDALFVALDLLSQTDAIALLRAVAGRTQAQERDEALAEIADLCGRLPLALRMAAALLRHRPAWPTEHLARLMSDHRGRMASISDHDRDLNGIFDLSYDSLDGRQQQLFRRLGLIPGHDVDAYAAAALTDAEPHAAGRLLEELVDHNLLIQHVAGRYRQHDLIRLHARALADHDPAPDLEAALDRLLTYYTRTGRYAEGLVAREPRFSPAVSAPELGPALPDKDSAWIWLRAERTNLLAAVQHAADHGLADRSVSLTACVATLLHVDGPWPLALALHTGAAAAARSLGDRAGQAASLARLAHMRALMGDFSGAVGDMDAALRLYRELDDREGQAGALMMLGEMRRPTGDLSAASRDLREALRLYQDLEDPPGQAYVLTQLGDMRRADGDLPGASNDLHEALRLYRVQGHRIGQADVLTRLADVRRVAGDLAEAARNLEEALRYLRDAGSRLGQANALARLGEVRRLLGDLPGAARDLERALHSYQSLGHRLGQGNALTFLGQVRLSDGDPSGAARHLEAAVDLFRRLGTPGNEAWAMCRYAAAIAATGDNTRGMAIYQDALHLAREAHHPDDEAQALEGIGDCQLRAGDARAGAENLGQALRIFQRLAMAADADRVATRLQQLAAGIC